MLAIDFPGKKQIFITNSTTKKNESLLKLFVKKDVVYYFPRCTIRYENPITLLTEPLLV